MYLKLIEFSGRDTEIEVIENLLSAWVNNGQVISDDNCVFNKEDSKIVSVITPQRDSLNSKWANQYVEKWLKILKSTTKLSIRSVGTLKNTFATNGINTDDFLILFLTDVFTYNPIRTWKTLEPIPLYLFPKTSSDNDYFDIISLCRYYRSINNALDSGLIHNKKYKNEVIDLNSNLNKSIRQLCHKIEILTHTPVFFFHYHYTYNTDVIAEINRILNNNETYIDIDNEFFQLINVEDRIVSNITPNLIDEARKTYKGNSAISKLKVWSGR